MVSLFVMLLLEQREVLTGSSFVSVLVLSLKHFNYHNVVTIKQISSFIKVLLFSFFCSFLFSYFTISIKLKQINNSSISIVIINT